MTLIYSILKLDHGQIEQTFPFCPSNFTSLRDETKDEKLKRKERKMTDVTSIKSQFKSARAK